MNKKSYYVRARQERRKNGGVWSPKNSDGIGFWCSLAWHEIEADDSFAKIISNNHFMEIHPVEFDKGYEDHPSKQKGWKKKDVISSKDTIWTVPNNTLRRDALSAIFQTDPLDVGEGQKVPQDVIREEPDEDYELEIIPDSVTQALKKQKGPEDLTKLLTESRPEEED